MEQLENYRFEDVHEFIGFYAQKLLEEGRKVKTTNERNEGTLKAGLTEKSQQFMGFRNPHAVIFNLPHFTTNSYWLIGEFIIEMLALNPPIMAKYSPTTINESYTLLPSAHLEYTYGGTWRQSRQLE